MPLCPITTIVWTGHARPSLFVMADGQRFQIVDLGDEREPDLAEELALDDAMQWGRDPTLAPPQGWRYASLREFFPLP